MTEEKVTTKQEASMKRVGGTEATHEASRPKRISLHDQKSMLEIHGKEAGYVYRVVNDIDDRIARFKLAGWEPVTHNLQIGDLAIDTAKSKGGVATVNVRGGIIAYVMRIKEELYEQDQAAKQRDLDASQEELYRELNKNDGTRYGEVKIFQNPGIRP